MVKSIFEIVVNGRFKGRNYNKYDKKYQLNRLLGCFSGDSSFGRKEVIVILGRSSDRLENSRSLMQDDGSKINKTFCKCKPLRKKNPSQSGNYPLFISTFPLSLCNFIAPQGFIQIQFYAPHHPGHPS
jgi:hypothetical protein